jgi:hypothetical protein
MYRAAKLLLDLYGKDAAERAERRAAGAGLLTGFGLNQLLPYYVKKMRTSLQDRTSTLR